MPGEQQHYVPKFLLKNFTRGKKPQIHVYDKSNDRRFKTHIKNIAAEAGFYEIELEDSVLTVEPSLSDLETHASAIIKKLIERKPST